MTIPVSSFKLSKNIPYKLPEIIDITDKLIKKDKLLHRELTDITGISVHHSGVEGATIESYANYHVKSRGWHCIGYTFVIKGRQIYQTNKLDTLSYHTHSANMHNIGVCVSANLEKRHITKDEEEALHGLILSLMEAFNFTAEHVKGHKEFADNNTSCPGTLDLNDLRSDLYKLQINMKKDTSIEGKKKRANQVMGEVKYLLDTASTKEGGLQLWALQQLDEIYTFMESKKLVK